MNNSLPRLIDGMVATLRDEIIPRIDGEFARGQAYGLIYLLNSIRLRADWSPAFFSEQLAAQDELVAALAGLDVPVDLLPQQTSAETADPRAMEARRDAGDERICVLIDWLEDGRAALPAANVAAVDAALKHYMSRQLRCELKTSAKPMFAQISSGSD